MFDDRLIHSNKYESRYHYTLVLLNENLLCCTWVREKEREKINSVRIPPWGNFHLCGYTFSHLSFIIFDCVIHFNYYINKFITRHKTIPLKTKKLPTSCLNSLENMRFLVIFYSRFSIVRIIVDCENEWFSDLIIPWTLLFYCNNLDSPFLTFIKHKNE